MKNEMLISKNFLIRIFKKILYACKFKKKTFELVIISNIINPKNIIFDIGANLGQTVDKFLLVNKNLYFYVFEPYCKYFYYLKKKYKQNKNVRIFNYGIGSKNEIRNFYFTNNKKHQFAFSFNKANYLDHKQRVKIIKLDSEFVKFKNVDVIKIDVEGLEYQVLLGAQKIIKKNKPFILLEVTSLSIDKCISLLRKIGYSALVYEYFIFKNSSSGWTKNNVLKSNSYKNEFYKIDNFLNKKNKTFVLNLFVFKNNLEKNIKNYSINSIKLP